MNGTDKIKVWLDDLRDPKDFRPRQNWHWCRTNTEFMRVLDTMPWLVAEVAIDHDKCHQVPVSLFMDYFVDNNEEKHIKQAMEQVLDGVLHEYTCDETFEAGARYLALWAQVHDKKDFPVTIVTSNTTKVDGMIAILQSTGNRFIITKDYGARHGKDNV